MLREHHAGGAVSTRTRHGRQRSDPYSTRLRPFVDPPPHLRWVAVAVIAVSLVSAWWFVELTGGVKYSAVHLVYVPVVLAALVFEVPGALIAGVAAGLAVGPFMPLDTSTGEPQEPRNWLLRMFFFCLIGALVGVGAQLLRRHMRYLEWLHDHDSPSGLLTRSGLIKHLQREIAAAPERDGPVVLVVHLNNLLDIQNSFGATFGERVVHQICVRGRTLIPPEHPLALIQPDRLAVVFSSAAEMDEVRKDVDSTIRAPYVIDDLGVYVDFTYGTAEYPTDATSADELLQKACIAMHLAVRRGLPWLGYDTASDLTSRDNLVLLAMVPAAIAGRELTIWHQAKTSLATSRVAGTEALVRWNHPERGLLMPGRFMPQVESSPLIDDLTWWVVDAALGDLAMWTQRGNALGVSVNVSVRNLHNRALPRILEEAVARHGVAPEDVDLEITESAVMDDFEHCVMLVRRLRELGFSVSIDDFGTGHSSLAYLQQLPVTKLKIDQAFVRTLAVDTRNQRIVRSVIDLAAALDLESVAEGVEDQVTAELLREWGCDYAQGNFLHAASPIDEFIPWVEQQIGPGAGSPLTPR